MILLALEIFVLAVSVGTPSHLGEELRELAQRNAREIRAARDAHVRVSNETSR